MSKQTDLAMQTGDGHTHTYPTHPLLELLLISSCSSSRSLSAARLALSALAKSSLICTSSASKLFSFRSVSFAAAASSSLDALASSASRAESLACT